MDGKTLQLLLDEAKKNYSRCRRVFLKTDNIESMDAMDMWANTATWLKGKLAELRREK